MYNENDESAQQIEGGEGRQAGYVAVLWAGRRKGKSPERPAWEWVSISAEPPPSPPSLTSPLFTAAFLFDHPLYFSPSVPLLEEG